MPLVPPPDGVCRFTLSGTYDGTSTFANVYHVLAGSLNPLSTSQMNDLIEDLIGAFDASGFYDNMSDTCGVDLASLVASDGSSLYGADLSVSSLNGTLTGGKNAGGIAAVVSWLGTWHYRGGKPRQYLPGLTDGWTATPTLLDATLVTSQEAAAEELITLIQALSGSYGSDVALGALIGQTSSSAGIFYAYNGARVSQQVGSQRRRNR